MVQNALGLIEIVGLAAALEAADAALKAANVQLIGYEMTKGGGMVVIKLTGNVGAVSAAVQAGKAAGSKVNKVFATHIIPRPHETLSGIVTTKDTVGFKEKKNSVVEKEKSEEIQKDKEIVAVDELQLEVQEEIEAAEKKKIAPSEQLPVAEQPKKVSGYCNICGDPACPRVKGDPKITCIHYDRNNKEAE
ncbi:Carboxysome shell and ethanolamine utilization microcompartment protein CcmL/EutN [Pelosinus fermentans]|jgi:microcompartment protein CcmL/EutN|uniref:Microcompartments protein n=1 Tax=Pelosinus fermentans B4 TaxID=1149862 RepID=I9B1H3_9FIRM|nr:MULTISPECIES: BMC domain-containing protein [Pelosinus]EIW18987.1 microcompartments protein [Pelosinus fermentans B4]OAM95347.1 microcompartments protein [Pelosinus fermentans DSM 17108]SDR26793.1 Carboxysome shell and ethanolamine utilization microcompartment protein CcmL/EutN [Pelosinus fermentans]